MARYKKWSWKARYPVREENGVFSGILQHALAETSIAKEVTLHDIDGDLEKKPHISQLRKSCALLHVVSYVSSTTSLSHLRTFQHLNSELIRI